MKYYHTFLVCLLLAFIFTSCGDDDIATLNGEWDLISSVAEGSESGVCDGVAFNYEFQSVGKNMDYTLLLKDGIFSGLGFYEFDLTSTGSMNPKIMEGDTSNIGFEPPFEFATNGTYTLMDGVLNTSQSIYGYLLEPLSISSQSHTYEVDGDELTLILNNENMIDDGDGNEWSSMTSRTTTWLKQ